MKTAILFSGSALHYTPEQQKTEKKKYVQTSLHLFLWSVGAVVKWDFVWHVDAHVLREGVERILRDFQAGVARLEAGKGDSVPIFV